MDSSMPDRVPTTRRFRPDAQGKVADLPVFSLASMNEDSGMHVVTSGMEITVETVAVNS